MFGLINSQIGASFNSFSSFGNSGSISSFAIFLLAAVASVTDVARGRIYNWLTLPLTLAALIFATVTQSWSGLGHSLLGLALGLLLYGWMFWIGVLGGGDVKLLMAFGAWGGAQYVGEVALMGILLGGAMSILMLLSQGHLVNFGKKLYRFILSLAVKELEVEMVQVNRKLTMPFGVPISLAAVWVLLGHPLEHWGPHL
jgi:prepilin peptidase CpaA